MMHFGVALYGRCSEALYVQHLSLTREKKEEALFRSTVRTAPMKNILHFSQKGDVQVALYTTPKANCVSLFKTMSLHLDTLYICLFHLRSFLESSKAYFYLAYFSKRKISPKNSPFFTQTPFHDHQTSSSIILDHLDIILHGFFNTLCLVSFSLISYIFSVFFPKQSHLLLVCH